MKYFADFVSFIAVAMAVAMSLKHRLPWIISAYLIAQTLFALCGWWVELTSGHESRAYLFFFGTFALVLVLAIGCALFAPMPRWIGLMGIVSLAVALFFAGARIYAAKAPVSSGGTLSLVNGGVLLLCGILALLSLVEPLSADMSKAEFCLGMFWTLQGLFGWVFAASRGKVWAFGVDLNDFAPQFIAIVCFAGLAVLLSGAQPELGRQEIRGMVTAQVEYER